MDDLVEELRDLADHIEKAHPAFVEVLEAAEAYLASSSAGPSPERSKAARRLRDALDKAREIEPA